MNTLQGLAQRKVELRKEKRCSTNLDNCNTSKGSTDKYRPCKLLSAATFASPNFHCECHPLRHGFFFSPTGREWILVNSLIISHFLHFIARNKTVLAKMLLLALQHTDSICLIKGRLLWGSQVLLEQKRTSLYSSPYGKWLYCRLLCEHFLSQFCLVFGAVKCSELINHQKQGHNLDSVCNINTLLNASMKWKNSSICIILH